MKNLGSILPETVEGGVVTEGRIVSVLIVLEGVLRTGTGVAAHKMLG